MRFEKEVNIYGDEVVIKRFKANETSIKVVQGNISAMISESELVELQNGQGTMYSKLASAVMGIKDLNLKFSDLTTKYDTVTGKYDTLDSKVAEYKAGVDGLSADISTVRQNLEGNYSTTTAMNAAISAKVEELSMSVSSTYSRKSDLIDASNRINELETWKKEAAIKITDNAIVSTVTKSSAYQNSVNSLIEQKADSIRLKADRISWESTYSSMTAWGTLTCENATIKGTLYSENGKNRVYLRNGQMQIFYNDQKLGLIGGNGFERYPNIEGLNFDLELTGDYMIWAAQERADSPYITKLTYARTAFGNFRADALNAGCDLDMHYYKLRNVNWPSGGITQTIKYVQVKAVNSNGTLQTWGPDGMMKFENGILVDLTYY